MYFRDHIENSNPYYYQNKKELPSRNYRHNSPTPQHTQHHQQHTQKPYKLIPTTLHLNQPQPQNYNNYQPRNHNPYNLNQFKQQYQKKPNPYKYQGYQNKYNNHYQQQKRKPQLYKQDYQRNDHYYYQRVTPERTRLTSNQQTVKPFYSSVTQLYKNLKTPRNQERYRQINQFQTIHSPRVSIQKPVKLKIKQTNTQLNFQPYYMQSLAKALNRPYSNDYFEILFRQHFMQTYQSMRRLRQMKIINKAIPRFDMPTTFKKKTIVFDLDQTLVHCCDSHQTSDITLNLKLPTGQMIESRINIRPYAAKLLQSLAQVFQLIVYTASHSIYANRVVDELLDPEGKLISLRLSREHCRQAQQGYYVKDLSNKQQQALINRPLQDMVIIDNAVYSFSLQISNGIPILPYYTNKQDGQLHKLQKFLLSLQDVEDVRKVLIETFQIKEYIEQNAQIVFQKIFK